MRHSLLSWLQRPTGIDSEFPGEINALDWFSRCGSTPDSSSEQSRAE